MLLTWYAQILAQKDTFHLVDFCLWLVGASPILSYNLKIQIQAHSK